LRDLSAAVPIKQSKLKVENADLRAHFNRKIPQCSKPKASRRNPDAKIVVNETGLIAASIGNARKRVRYGCSRCVNIVFEDRQRRCSIPPQFGVFLNSMPLFFWRSFDLNDALADSPNPTHVVCTVVQSPTLLFWMKNPRITVNVCYFLPLVTAIRVLRRHGRLVFYVDWDLNIPTSEMDSVTANFLFLETCGRWDALWNLRALRNYVKCRRN
jgi:hypothetical protein